MKDRLNEVSNVGTAQRKDEDSTDDRSRTNVEGELSFDRDTQMIDHHQAELDYLGRKISAGDILGRIDKTSRWKQRSHDELLELPQLQLSSLFDKLRVIVEGVSTELVTLLQERDGLEEEVGTRNIAIEQLLKIQNRMAWHMSSPLAVQMGVVVPSRSAKDAAHVQVEDICSS